MFTGRVLLVLFELFAPVSECSVNLLPSTHSEPHTEIDPASSLVVSYYLKSYNRDKSDELLPCP